MESTERYQDIINLPHHQSKTYPRMSLENRAAQFSPFAALKGYDEAIDETARFTEEQFERGEDAKAALNDKLFMLRLKIAERPAVRVTYFKPDEKKKGGAFCTAEGTLVKVDPEGQKIVLSSNLTLSFDQLIEIEIQ